MGSESFRGLEGKLWSKVLETLDKLFESGVYSPTNFAMSLGLDRKLRGIVYNLARGRVLDVGCGDGYYSLPLLENAQEVVCVDPLARKGSESDPRLHVVKAIAEYLPLRSKSVEFSTAMFSFRDFLDKPRGLSEMKRASRIGVFIVEIFNPSTWFRPFLYAYVLFIAPLLAFLVSRGKGKGWRLLYPTIRIMPRASLFERMGGKVLVSKGFGSLAIVYLPVNPRG
ncbi:class I SAM-dependent methyltransferase [Thermofilum pendens]|uniref:class I SAM-dependent methyltransferase n=1 Tax=Thermofilum pendens TaxID=2269 RepID=UPI00069B030B|nr:methyltransferase domain-containing protein [Thermofilum pendens]